MHPTNSRKSADRESFIASEDDGMVDVSLEDPWVRRQDVADYKRIGRGYSKRQGSLV